MNNTVNSDLDTKIQSGSFRDDMEKREVSILIALVSLLAYQNSTSVVESKHHDN